MDEISKIDQREDDEPVVNSTTSQFSNPPNYKIYASNANLNQDSSLPKFNGSKSTADIPPNENKNCSVNAFSTFTGQIPGNGSSSTDFNRVPLLCTFWDGNVCNYKGSGRPCDRRHQPGIDQRPWARNETSSVVQMNTQSTEWQEYLKFQCFKRQKTASNNK